jgi:hypothetical protein
MANSLAFQGLSYVLIRPRRVPGAGSSLGTANKREKFKKDREFTLKSASN